MFVIDSPICVSIGVPSNLDICTSLTVIHRWKTYKNCGRHCFKYVLWFADALGTSAGVRGHGAAGRAGGTAPTARSQTSPFHIGMGEAAEVTGTGDGGSAARDGGARCTREVRGRSRAARSAAQHTAARRRVRTGRASTVTSPLSASRADEKQLPASTEQVRERRARRVTARAESTLTFHIRAARAARAPDSYRLAIYLFGSAAPRPCSSRRLRVSRKLRLR